MDKRAPKIEGVDVYGIGYGYYLTNTIKNAKIIKDWIHRRVRIFQPFVVYICQCFH